MAMTSANGRDFKNIGELVEFVLEECHDIKDYEFTSAGTLIVKDPNFTIRAVYYLDSMLKINFPGYGGVGSLEINIDDLTEIEDGYLEKLEDLTSLTVWSNRILRLPKLPPNLTYLDVYDDEEIFELPELPNSVDTLNISYTKISDLPNLPDKLQDINMFGTPLAEKGDFESPDNRQGVLEFWKKYKSFNESILIREQNEEKEIQLYFIHPEDTFKTDVEDKAIELINIYFDTPYIENYGKDKISLQRVPEANTVVVMPYSNNRIDSKMLGDIRYAFEKGLSIYWLSPSKYKIYKKDSIAFFTDKMERGSKNDLENYFNI